MLDLKGVKQKINSYLKDDFVPKEFKEKLKRNIETAKIICRLIEPLVVGMNSFLGFEGEIQVSGYNKFNTIEITTDNDNTLTWVVEDLQGNDIEYFDKLSINDIVKRILLYGRKND